jgi:hypothetical protein
VQEKKKKLVDAIITMDGVVFKKMSHDDTLAQFK